MLFVVDGIVNILGGTAGLPNTQLYLAPEADVSQVITTGVVDPATVTTRAPATGVKRLKGFKGRLFLPGIANPQTSAAGVNAPTMPERSGTCWISG